MEGAGSPLAGEARFEPKPGVVVAEKYRVERVIGEGGMGVVVSATHEGLDQRVAIKFLLPEAMRNQEAVERFLREAKVAARVKSEHVARVSDVGTVSGGVPFIVMEYLAGDDLGALIARDGPLAVADACEIGLQACEALAEVHAAGIVHRDLKPSNLFLTRRADGSPCVKLLDFGISKFTMHDDAGVDPALTATATVMGSPSYMSPEQLKSTKEVDARTDVWSLGAVLYEALTGKPAFRGETVVQVCAMIASEEPAPPSSVRGAVPADLERIVLACLDKKADARASLADLARTLVKHAPERARVSLERLEAVLGEERSPPPPPPVSRPAVEVARTQASWGEEPKAKRGGGGPLLLLAIVAGGLFAAGVYTGKIDLAALKGQVASATSAAASAVSSATTTLASAMPAVSATPAAPAAPPALSTAAAGSAPPVVSASPVVSAAPSASTALPAASAAPEPDPSASAEPDEDEDPFFAPPAPAPSSSAVASAAPVAAAPHAPAPPYVAPVRRVPQRPRHGVHKYVHKHH
jgi:serine/threonine-protein kinase